MSSKYLFPIDGSDYGLRVIQHWLSEHPETRSAQLHLLNVQLPVDGNVRTFVDAEELHAYHRAEGEEALQAVRAWLEEGGVDYQHHILVGHPADIICRFATEYGISEIVMSSHGRGGLLDRLLGSVTQEVQEKSSVPVDIVRYNSDGMQLRGS